MYAISLFVALNSRQNIAKTGLGQMADHSIPCRSSIPGLRRSDAAVLGRGDLVFADCEEWELSFKVSYYA